MITDLSRGHSASAYTVPYSSSMTQKFGKNRPFLSKLGIAFPPVQSQQLTVGWTPEKGIYSLLKLRIIITWVIPGIAESWVHERFGTHMKSKADVSLMPPSIWIIYIVQYPIWLPSVPHSNCRCCSLSH